MNHFNKSLLSEACFLCYLEIFKTSQETNSLKDAYNESFGYRTCKQTPREQVRLECIFTSAAINVAL